MESVSIHCTAKLQGTARVSQSSFLSWTREPADHCEYSYDMSELTCDVVLTSASDSFSEKKRLSEKLPLRYDRWKLTANEGQRKRERTFAVQQMEADCKARAAKEDKCRASPFI